MSFNLGLIAGFGRAQREVNMREHDENLSAEKTKNDATAALLHDFMLRDDVTPEVRQAAIGSLMQFSQQPGLPTAKHRQAAMDGLLGAFNTQRSFTPNTGNNAGGGEARADMNGVASVPGAGTGTPEPRTGFLRADEIAQRTGTASGLQMRSLASTMRGGTGAPADGTGADSGLFNMPGPNGSTMAMTPDGKFHMINPSYTYSPGVDANDQPTVYAFDHRTPTRPIDVVHGGTMQDGARTGINARTRTVTTLDANGQPITKVIPNTETGSFARPIPTRDRVTYDEMGNQVLTSITPGFNGRPNTVSSQQQIGTQPNAALKRQNLAASLNLKGLTAQQKQQAIELASLRVEGRYTDGSVPSWMQTDQNGNPVPLAVAPGARPTAVGQNKAQAAALGLHIVDQITPLAQKIESKFGPIEGNLRQWAVAHGLNEDPDVKDLMLLSTHLSASIPAVQQFRSGEIMHDYHAVLGGINQPFANYKRALQSTRGVLEEAFNEGVRPIVPRTTSTRSSVPTRAGAAAATAASTTTTPTATPAHKVGDRVIYKGKHTVIKAVYPDGTYEVQ